MKNYKILAEFIKDVSSETKDVQTYLFVKDYISKYQLTIDINSQPTKNKLIEVSTFLKFEDKLSLKRSYPLAGIGLLGFICFLSAMLSYLICCSSI